MITDLIENTDQRKTKRISEEGTAGFGNSGAREC